MSKEKTAQVVRHPSATLDDNAIRKIGEKLREQYNEIADEPVPDRFMELLSQLEGSDSSGSEEGK